MAESDDEERFPEFAKLDRIPGVDYSIHQRSDEKVKRSHPEVWKYNCEHDPVRNPSLRREYEEERFPEFAKLERIPGVDYGVHGMWQGQVKLWNPEGWKLNCERDPDRNPHLVVEGSDSGPETKRLCQGCDEPIGPDETAIVTVEVAGSKGSILLCGRCIKYMNGIESLPESVRDTIERVFDYVPGVDYGAHSPAEGMLAKQHPEVWKRVCEELAKDAETNEKEVHGSTGGERS